MRYTTSMDQEMKRRVTACAAGFSLPRYRELPAVGKKDFRKGFWNGLRFLTTIRRKFCREAPMVCLFLN